MQDLALDEQDRAKQADYVRRDAYRFSRLLGKQILTALRDNDKNSLKDRFIQWGIAVDKVLGGAESSGFTLHIPPQLMDKFMLALRIGTDKTPQAIDNQEKS